MKKKRQLTYRSTSHLMNHTARQQGLLAESTQQYWPLYLFIYQLYYNYICLITLIKTTPPSPTQKLKLTKCNVAETDDTRLLLYSVCVSLYEFCVFPTERQIKRQRICMKRQAGTGSLQIHYQKDCWASEHAVRSIQPLAEQRKKLWKVYGLVEEKIHKVYIYSHQSCFFLVVISKTTTAADEAVEGGSEGSLTDDHHGLLETPG